MSVLRFALPGLLLVLAACAPMPARQVPDAALLAAQAGREAALAAEPAWSVSGRIAVSAGRDGGSGRIDWNQDGADFDIRLSAPVSRQSWRLLRAAGQTRLEGLPDGPREARDAEALLWRETGWRIPIDALAAWVRGARAAGPARIEFRPDGLPASLTQSGWQVEYRDFDPEGRPRRIFARTKDASVRLVIDGWR